MDGISPPSFLSFDDYAEWPSVTGALLACGYCATMSPRSRGKLPPRLCRGGRELTAQERTTPTMARGQHHADVCGLRPPHAAGNRRGEARRNRAHAAPGSVGARGPSAPRCCAARCRTRRCRAASGRWRSTSIASTRATTATSACPCSRCGTSPRATSTSGAAARSGSPEDLAGKRIGMYSYTRQRLDLVPPLPALRRASIPAAIQWWIGDIDMPRGRRPMDPERCRPA